MARSARQPNQPPGNLSRRLLTALLYAFILLGAVLPANAADPFIEALRNLQQQQLDALRSEYDAKIRANPTLIKPDGTVDTSHPEYKATVEAYAKAKQQVQSTYSKQDPRNAELAKIAQTHGKDVETTGSGPKDVRADVDLTAKTDAAADAIVAQWIRNGDTVVYDPKLGIHINKSKDATLWAPPSKEQLEARASYHDSFSTPGGKKATGVKGDEAITDKEGFVLDNEKKFIHAASALDKAPEPDTDATKASLDRATALKTAGKSVSKAADSVSQTSEVAQQADGLRNYKDDVETGITPLGATPEQQKQSVRDFVQKADQQIQNSKTAAEQQSAVTRQAREELAKQTEGKDKTPMVDADGKPLPTTAEAIRARNEKIAAENAKARAANEAERQKTGLPPAPKPNDAAVGTTAKTPAAAKPSTETKEGSAANAAWKTTTTKDGDTSTTRTSTATTEDGGIKATDKTTTTTQTGDGGKVSSQTSTTTTVDKDGKVAKTTTQSTTETPGKPVQDGYVATTSKTQTHTSGTDKDGNRTQSAGSAETGKTKGGGATSSDTTTTQKTGADGATSHTAQKTTTYTAPDKPDGKQTSVTTSQTTQGETDAKGGSRTTTDKSVTHTKSDGEGGSESKTTSQTQTSETGADGSRSTGKSTTLTTKTESANGETSSHTATTGKTTTTDGSGRTSTTDSESTVDSDGRGGKTTTTDTTTTSPHTTSTESTWGYEKTHSGQDDAEPAQPTAPSSTPKAGVKWGGGEIFKPVDEDGGRAASTSGAGETEIGGVKVEGEGEAKVQVGQAGAKGGWEVTSDNKDGTKASADVSAEANAVKVTVTGSGEAQITEGVTVGGKVTGTAKVGAEAKGNVTGQITTDSVAVSTEAKVFVGGKAELEAEGYLGFWGLKFTGKGQAEVSYGAGAEAKVEAELSWTKIKLGGKLATTLGLGGGTSGSFELDATEAITGYDLNKLDQQMKAAEAMTSVTRGLRTGTLKLPPGKTWADVREELIKRADFYSRHPQKDAKGKPINIVDSLKNEFGLTKGKGGGYVTSHHSQKDWYCTNRPEIKAPVALPPILNMGQGK